MEKWWRTWKEKRCLKTMVTLWCTIHWRIQTLIRDSERYNDCSTFKFDSTYHKRTFLYVQCMSRIHYYDWLSHYTSNPKTILTALYTSYSVTLVCEKMLKVCDSRFCCTGWVNFGKFSLKDKRLTQSVGTVHPTTKSTTLITKKVGSTSKMMLKKKTKMSQGI